MMCFSCGYTAISSDGTCMNCGEYNPESDSSRDPQNVERLELLEIEIAGLKNNLYVMQQNFDKLITALNDAKKASAILPLRKKKMTLR